MFNAEPLKVAAPLLPVVDNIIVFCLLLKVFQSAADNKPCCEALAVAMFNVSVPAEVTGDPLILMPPVGEDNPTLVTVPLLLGMLVQPNNPLPLVLNTCPPVPSDEGKV